MNLHLGTISSKLSIDPKLTPLIIAGPTAAGKSSLALQIAGEMGGEIINADSKQIYVDVPIITAQPSVSYQALCPHHLYGHHAGSEPYSVGKWLEELNPVLISVWERGHKPIIVGGTGMYLQALIEGIAPIPNIDACFVEQAKERFEVMGKDKLANWLTETSPEHTGTVYLQDPQRLIRASSVFLATGRSIVSWQKEPKIKLLPMAPEFKLTAPIREDLYSRIDQRVLSMIEAGAVKEVETLLTRITLNEAPVWKIIGVGELAAYLQEKITLDQAISKIQQHTRNYAKRQMTWFRNRL